MKNDKKRAPQILSTIETLAPQLLLIAHPRASDLVAREACVRRVAREACDRGVGQLVLDRMGSAEDRDKSWLFRGTREAGFHKPPFAYGHRARHAEPLLWIPDAVAWAWQRGGEYRRRVRPWVHLIEL